MNEQYETLRVSRAADVLTVHLHRPAERNAINIRMVNELSDLMDWVAAAKDISVFVLRGDHDVFSGGIDLRDFTTGGTRDVYGFQKWEQMARQFESLAKFTVAAVQGECIGGGAQLALLCDSRVAERKAVICFNEVKLGFLPGMATFRLAKHVGLGRAKNLVLTGRRLRAAEALAWGLIDEVCDLPDFETTLQDAIRSLLPFHPVALQMARRLLHESFHESYEDFLGHFLAAQHRAINSEAFSRLVARLANDERPAGGPA